LIILAYQPTIIYSDVPSLDSEDMAHASKDISASSAKTILDIVTFAELVSYLIGRSAILLTIRSTPKPSLSPGSTIRYIQPVAPFVRRTTPLGADL
jgi:hypothetical protein